MSKRIKIVWAFLVPCSIYSALILLSLFITVRLPRPLAYGIIGLDLVCFPLAVAFYWAVRNPARDLLPLILMLYINGGMFLLNVIGMVLKISGLDALMDST